MANLVTAAPGWKVAFISMGKVDRLEDVAAWLHESLMAWPMVRGVGAGDERGKLLVAQTTVDAKNYRVEIVPPGANVAVGDPRK